MPKFASYNPSIVPVAPIIGWYDTDRYSYSDMPSPSELFAVTDAEWSSRFFGNYGIEDGELVLLSQ